MKPSPSSESTKPASSGNYRMNDGDNSGYINSSVLSPESGKPIRRSVTSDSQLKEVVTRLEQENNERAIKNSRIMGRYNAEQPYNQSELVAQGLGWKANFSTRPLAAIIDRLAPRYVRAAQGPRYVTNASLRSEHEDHRRKTEFYRKELTSLLRAHPKWKSLLTEIAQENALFGYTLACIPDDVSWMPRHFRQDEFFVPVGTGQLACEAQVIAIRESCLVSELYQRVEDRDIAEAAGWDVDATVEAINSAKPDSVSDNVQHSFRGYEDLRRDGAMALGVSGGQTSVKLYHVLVTEITGKVSHYILAGDDKKRIFRRTDRYEKMDDAATFFTFQQGNGRLHGSLGVGRLAYNIASAVDRARCEVVDRFQMSGKLLLSTDAKDLTRFKMTVMGQAAIIGNGYTINQQKLESGVSEFVQLDQFLNGILNDTAGNVAPNSPNLQGERVTAAAVGLVAAREEELRDTRLERFLDGFLMMVGMIQRRLANEDVARCCPLAARFRKRCLAVMSKKEFEEISECPAAETIDDLTDDERQRQVLALNELAADPYADQYKVRKMKYTLLLGEDNTNELLINQDDPNVAAAAQRQQILELMALQQGLQVPVLPTDNHGIHLQVCMQAMQTAQTPDELNLIGEHAMQHAQGTGDKNAINQVRSTISELVKAMTEAQAAAANEQPQTQIDPNLAPIPGEAELLAAQQAGLPLA